MIRVLGIDPGSRATGWALVVASGNRLALEGAGVVRPRGDDRVARLADLGGRIAALVAELGPECAAVESSFTGVNPRSGLMLAESRGAILAAIGGSGIECHPYSPAQVKSAVVGNGRAEKQQVGFMVVRLLGTDAALPADAADAAAVAITHVRLHGWRRRVAGAAGP